MKTLNVHADKQHFMDTFEGVVLPGQERWRDGLGRNAAILTRDPVGPGTVEQRDLRSHEADAILRMYDKHRLAPGQVVVKTLYAGICGSDLKNAYSDTCSYPYNPGKVLTHEMSGVVVAVGDGVEGFEVGDLVVGNPLLTDQLGNPIIDGDAWNDRNGPFSSIHTHGFAQEYVIHPVSRLHKVDSTKIGPRLAALAEPFACAHSAVERKGRLTESLASRRTREYEQRYGRYTFGVVIIGGGGLGTITAVMAKHLGADKVLVLDNNPAKVALIDSLGEGFRGVCTDWLKEGRGSVDDARLAAMHEGIRLECRSNGLHGKGADMLINCVADPSAVFRHVGVLDGTRSPMIVQAGGSREPIAWSTALNRSFMTAEATYTHAYRYAPEDFDAALECLYSHPELAARLIGSITPSGVQGNSGARGAFERARSDSGRSGKSLIGYSGEHDEDQIFEHSKGELVASPG